MLSSSPEAVLGWKSNLYDMGELPDAKNRPWKASRGHEHVRETPALHLL